MIPAQPLTVDEFANESTVLLKLIRRWIAAFMILLVLSGITAFPVQTELHFLVKFHDCFPPLMRYWLLTVSSSVDDVATNAPYLLYGYDWLAYAHIVIALFFTGVYRNPIQNEWVLRIGMLACAGVFVLAVICGQVRGIPFFWTLIDCSFGLFGMIPLVMVRRLIKRLEQITFHH